MVTVEKVHAGIAVVDAAIAGDDENIRQAVELACEAWGRVVTVSKVFGFIGAEETFQAVPDMEFPSVASEACIAEFVAMASFAHTYAQAVVDPDDEERFVNIRGWSHFERVRSLVRGAATAALH
ncbi:hypothetical protein [Ottowia sp.]|uniref:hypothetical protein n=1 Tax=Ottowia sp. TaxID=1898956 RepID=UPI0025CE9FFC|nr:hypothetical protein [Ottowia sp.]MBK6616220.1 hypothetical protein [Ottowia sp.]